MSLDGIVTKSIVNELKQKLVGGRVDKIYQQEDDEILIHAYSKGENYKLLISADSSSPRIHLTNHSKTNPQTPPMFCMLLRKHLIRGTILNIEQFEMDRVIFIDVSSLDELGLPSENRLVIEIMGRHSNIILINKESQIIMDSIKRVNHEMSRVRQVLPGLKYVNPPIGNKLNPLNLSKNKFYDLLKQNNENMKIFKFFYANYMGLSPLISKEFCYLAGIDKNKQIRNLTENDIELLYSSFESTMEKINNCNFNPILVEDPDSKGYLSFHALDLKQFDSFNKKYIDSISKVLEKNYKDNDSSNRISQKSQGIKKSIQTKLNRSLNKLSKQKEELSKSKDREKYKIYADVLSANLHKIESRKEEVVLENFYSENMEEIKIPLDTKYTPARNAQRYYKRYSKLKNANKLLERQIPETKDEINYLEHVLTSIENSTEVVDIEEIKEELIKEGYLRGRVKKKRRTSKASKPHEFISSDGYKIYVGKNNKQNEYLTLKFANKDDLWLHVKEMPGSHVIIKSGDKELSNIALEEAAILAAYYSKGKLSSNVPVDYTAVKNVRKARNGRTGMVNYENFKTLFVTPSKDLIDKFKKVES